MYFNYEIYMFLYYKWMNNYEFDQENTYKLLLDLMGFCNYYAARYFNLERLSEERVVLLGEMKLSTKVLSVIDKDFNQIVSYDIINQAIEHKNPLCLKVVDKFAEIFGTEVGNLALKTLPYGGIYLIGGVTNGSIILIERRPSPLDQHCRPLGGLPAATAAAERRASLPTRRLVPR